jgi:hypothetical protein
MGFFETGAVQTSAIAASALTGASGTGTAADPGGSVTGSVGDLVVTVAGWNSTTGYASVTDTVPNTGDTMQSGTVNGTHAWGGIGTYLIWKVVRTAGAHRRVMTWGASVSWAAAVFTVTPVPPSATPAASGLFKGRTTKTADLGAVA